MEKDILPRCRFSLCIRMQLHLGLDCPCVANMEPIFPSKPATLQRPDAVRGSTAPLPSLRPRLTPESAQRSPPRSGQYNMGTSGQRVRPETRYRRLSSHLVPRHSLRNVHVQLW
jgi:hypothetical protein